MPPAADRRLPWRRPRFGLKSLMLTTTVFCVMGAAGYHLLRSGQPRGGAVHAAPPLVFLLFTLAAPVLLVTVISLGNQLVHFVRRRPRQ